MNRQATAVFENSMYVRVTHHNFDLNKSELKLDDCLSTDPPNRKRPTNWLNQCTKRQKKSMHKMRSEMENRRFSKK